MNHKPVCVKCETEMYPADNGAICLDHFGDDNEPYQLWSCDKWKCHYCDTEILIGFGDRPLIRHFEEHFTESLESFDEKGHIVNNYEYIEKGDK